MSDRWQIKQEGFWLITDTVSGQDIPFKFFKEQAMFICSLLNEYERKLEEIG